MYIHHIPTVLPFLTIPPTPQPSDRTQHRIYPPITAYCLLLQVWSTGLNNYGQLGLGDLENRRLLQHVAALDDRAITEVGRCSRSVVRMNGRRAITEVGLVVLCG